MPREQIYQAIIIKKQSYGEADEIITLLTAEAGKVRALAKSVKLGTSKLQQALQPIFLNRLTLTGNVSLPKVINVQTLQSFPLIQEPEKIKIWFVMAELLNKALPDEQKNEPLFELVKEYLAFLNSGSIPEATLLASLIKFKIHFMELIGLQIHAPQATDDQTGLLFSASKGGFYLGQASSDSRSVTPATWSAFLELQGKNFADLDNYQADVSQLQNLVNQFISWQLEREIKADKFLG